MFALGLISTCRPLGAPVLSATTLLPFGGTCLPLKQLEGGHRRKNVHNIEVRGKISAESEEGFEI